MRKLTTLLMLLVVFVGTVQADGKKAPPPPTHRKARPVKRPPSLAETREANRHSEVVRRIKADNQRSYDQRWSSYMRDQLTVADHQYDRKHQERMQETDLSYRSWSQTSRQQFELARDAQRYAHKDWQQAVEYGLVTSQMLTSQAAPTPPAAPQSVPVEPAPPGTVSGPNPEPVVVEPAAPTVQGLTGAQKRFFGSWNEAMSEFQKNYGNAYRNEFLDQPDARPEWIPDHAYSPSGVRVSITYDPHSRCYGAWVDNAWVPYNLWGDVYRLQWWLREQLHWSW